MGSKTKFGFGKYYGLTPKQVARDDRWYLEWVLTTDHLERRPVLFNEIKKALAPPPLDITIELEGTELPDLTAIVRNDGKVEKGITAAILTSQGYCSCEEIQLDDQRPSPDAPGEVSQILPADDMVILLSEHRSDSKDETLTTWMARMDGDWNRIIPNNRIAAKAVLELMH